MLRTTTSCCASASSRWKTCLKRINESTMPSRWARRRWCRRVRYLTKGRYPSPISFIALRVSWQAGNCIS